MKKNNLTRTIMSVLYVVLIFVVRGIYLFWDKGLSAFQAIQTVLLEFGNLVIIIAFGLIVGSFILFVSNKLFKKKKDEKGNNTIL